MQDHMEERRVEEVLQEHQARRELPPPPCRRAAFGGLTKAVVLAGELCKHADCGEGRRKE
jgi:hypothetical protein